MRTAVKRRENGRPGKNKPGPRFRYGITDQERYLSEAGSGGRFVKRMSAQAKQGEPGFNKAGKRFDKIWKTGL